MKKIVWLALSFTAKMKIAWLALSLFVLIILGAAETVTEVSMDDKLLLWLLQAIVVPSIAYLGIQNSALKTKVAVLETNQKNQFKGIDKVEESVEKLETEFKQELEKVKDEIRDLPDRLIKQIRDLINQRPNNLNH